MRTVGDQLRLCYRPPLPVYGPPSSPPRRGDVLDDIEGNSRNITRSEVEAAISDWCRDHSEAPLCVKLRV
jgi:hypothetical protein